uniref:Uncharacterized protein n=1 Tax=Oryza nivara TaxID=4536 RepID=A0A0E0G6Q3_ORYNI
MLVVWRVATSQESNMHNDKLRKRTCELILTVQQLGSSTPGGNTNKTMGGEVPVVHRGSVDKGLLMVSAPTIDALDPEQWLQGVVIMEEANAGRNGWDAKVIAMGPTGDTRYTVQERSGKCGARGMAEHGRCMDIAVVVRSFSHPGLVRHNGV